MAVPFIDLKRFEEGLLERWGEKVSQLSATASFIGGAEVAQLEETLSGLAETKYCVSCANGTDAIQLALRALDVGRDDLVLVPNMTFWATFEAVVNVGATPVTVDSALSDGGIDLDAFTEAVEKYRPKAAVIAHLYGWGSANLQEIRDYCSANNVLLVEDGAQCFGTRYKSESIYKGALISTTSFYPAKVLGAAGDGGAVFTSDDLLAQRARQLANHGRTSHYGYGLVGWNSRLDSLQAAYLNLAIDFLPNRIQSRLDAVQFYKQHLTGLGINQMDAPKDFIENGYCHVGLINNTDLKDKVEAALKINNIGFGNIYPGAMSEQECSKRYMHAHVGGGKAQQICSTVINLPVFPHITSAELSAVVDVVNSACEEK
jgi:UDP-2-acetamido-2-deoxy-ribo-hexuluronate aminotransferase